MKFIVVTGGVISGLGKGITASSIGLLLQSRGLNVTAIKIDPYLNVDAGTMSPFEHGECYVLGDGGEVDLDLGNYERFLNIELTKDHNITTGKIYSKVIEGERNGKYLGKTVQMVPHVTDEIQDWIAKVSIIPIIDDIIPDICIIELGGTVGDIENKLFITAISQMASMAHSDHEFCFVHVGMIIETGGEYKTKPTQHSITELRSSGIFPDILVIRSSKMLSQEILTKLSTFCQVRKENIICNIDLPNIYYVPNLFKNQNICAKIGKKLNINFINNDYDLMKYGNILDYFGKIEEKKQVNIAIAGKYVGSQDTYLSLIRAIEHAGFFLNINAKVHWIDTIHMNKIKEKYDGFIIPGGFGVNGVEGKLLVAKYARENDVPLLGICYGMHVMTIEYARSIGIIHGQSSEWDGSATDPIIHILPGQNEVMGGTMRLGNYETRLKVGTKIHKIYGKTRIIERHRHRYEFNNDYCDILTKHKLVISGISEGNKLVETIELADKKFYLGCQFHPEYKTRYTDPHPLFIAFLKSTI